MVLDWMVSGGGRISAWTMLLMAFLVTMDVSLRFLAGAGTKWAAEFTGYLLVATVFFGLSYTQREKAHIRIDFLVNRLPKKAQDWLDVIVCVLFLAFTAILFYLTLKSVSQSFSIQTRSQTGADVLIWPFQSFMPFGLALIFLQLIRDINHKLRIALGNKEVMSNRI